MQISDTPATSNPSKSVSSRYVPLAVWALVVLTLVLIPLKIASYGLIPAGDARRHVAKAFTAKPYTEILVMRPEYKMDHSPGWETLLRGLHRAFGWNRDALTSFAIVFPLILILLAPLWWFRRPEAWLAALLAFFLANPLFMWRLTQGRPYLITEAICMMLLLAWSRVGSNRRALAIAVAVIGTALSVWIHGAWYLWVIPVLAFAMAGKWGHCALLAASTGIGIVLGAGITGHPFVFLKQAVDIARLISSEHLPAAQLVGEFRPGDGNFVTLVLLAIVWLFYRRDGNAQPRFSMAAMACQVILCWILSLYADRFRADWGVPAVLLLLAILFEQISVHYLAVVSWKRLYFTAVIAVPLFLHLTNDTDERYTFSHSEVFLDAGAPQLQGWFPERGGIFYTADLDFFFRTFYENPTGDWRYLLGMEPALMPPDDLQTYRNIQRTDHAVSAYDPWLKKLRPIDRLVVFSKQQPPLPQLQWQHAGGSCWIGKLR